MDITITARRVVKGAPNYLGTVIILEGVDLRELARAIARHPENAALFRAIQVEQEYVSGARTNRLTQMGA
jgi:hypothetical protein